MPCPDDNELSEFVAGVLSAPDADRVDTHIDRCPRCRSLLAELASALEPPDGPSAAEDETPVAWPQDGYLGGRYVPQRVLGAGGMSLVYEGHDRVLRRRVALKVMLDAPEDVRARLRREARALGMLSHPNVVDVYDVDLSDGNAFLACELVDGGSLRAWLAETPRGWLQVVDVIIDAALGLEAAHRVGLVHRDVTPNNILIGADGRGRVADFGLARLPEAVGEETSPDWGSPGMVVARRTTGWVGTPGYVAPEVRKGSDAGASADQFGLCVTAYESLHGHLPGQQSAASRVVPRAIDRVLERGLREDPADRFASLAALRRALQRARNTASSPRRGILLLAAAGLAAIGWSATANEARPCERPDAIMPAIEIATAELPASITTEVDTYVHNWEQARTRTCDAANDDTVDARALDLRWACLRAHQRDFEALLRRLAATTSVGIEASFFALEGLHPATDCEDDAILARGFALPPEKVAMQVDRLQDQLSEARAARQVHKDAEARVMLEKLADAAARVGYDPLTAEVLLVRGGLEREAGETERARETLLTAAHLASGVNLDTVATWAWLQVYALEGYDAMDRDAAARVEPLLRANLARLDHPPGMEAQLAQTLGAIHDHFGEHALGEPYYAEAKRLTAAYRGTRSVRYADLLSNIGVHYARAGDFEAARKELAASRDLLAERLGADSPAVARGLTNLAGLELSAANAASAVGYARDALAIYERVLEPDDERIALLHGTLGQALVFDQKAADALPHLQRAEAMRAARLPASHPQLMDARYQLALALADVGYFDEAQHVLGLALAEVDGPSVPRQQRGTMFTEQGRIAARTGDFEEAVRACQSAVDVLATPPSEPWLSQAQSCLTSATAGEVEDKFKD